MHVVGPYKLSQLSSGVCFFPLDGGRSRWGCLVFDRSVFRFCVRVKEFIVILFLNFDHLFCDEEKCPIFIGQHSGYYDDDHMSTYGASVVENELTNALLSF